LCRLALSAFHERHVAFQHPLHLGHVLRQRLDRLVLLQQRQLQLEPGQDGAQVVADPRQHGGALLNVALDAALHLQERVGRRLHLRSAPSGRKSGTSRPMPKLCAASASFTIGLIWLRRKITAMSQQEQRSAHHPANEDWRGRGMRAVHVGQEPEHETRHRLLTRTST
jgi:hypothetical protein